MSEEDILSKTLHGVRFWTRPRFRRVGYEGTEAVLIGVQKLTTDLVKCCFIMPTTNYYTACIFYSYLYILTK